MSVFTLVVTNCFAECNRSFEFLRFQVPELQHQINQLPGEGIRRFPLPPRSAAGLSAAVRFLPGFESATPRSQMEPVVFAGERDAIHDHFRCRHEREHDGQDKQQEAFSVKSAKQVLESINI